MQGARETLTCVREESRGVHHRAVRLLRVNELIELQNVRAGVMMMRRWKLRLRLLLLMVRQLLLLLLLRVVVVMGGR